MEPKYSLQCSQESAAGPYPEPDEWIFITVFTRVRRRSLSWARWMQSTRNKTISLRFIVILTSHLRLNFPRDLFPSGSTLKILHIFIISSMRATCPSQPILLDLITLRIFGEGYMLW